MIFFFILIFSNRCLCLRSVQFTFFSSLEYYTVCKVREHTVCQVRNSVANKNGDNNVSVITSYVNMLSLLNPVDVFQKFGISQGSPDSLNSN